MILVTGGLGFIGLHTARALLDLGEDCVLTQYHATRDPDFLRADVGSRIFVERLDITDADALEALGRKYNFTGIVHLAAPDLNAVGPLEDYRINMIGLQNILQTAIALKVKRVSVGSSLAVYAGISELPWSEDMRLPIVGVSATEAFKKSFEILGVHVAARSDLDLICMRIAGIYGPLYHVKRPLATAVTQLTHAAVFGSEIEFGRGPAYEDDGNDLCYVKDCARGIALLQLADHLNHRVYNVASGRATTNREVLAAVGKAVPGFTAELKPGHNPNGTGQANYQSIARIKDDVGYEPAFDIDRAIEDYVGWLRAGNAE